MAGLVFITVAEASADLHAANLVRSLKEIDPGIVVEGIGGERMREAGAIVHHETTRRAAMGWRAALRAKEVSGWLDWARTYYDKNRPDLAICCDSWSMNWHFARLAKERGVPVLYYIAPQTWASREGRVAKLKKYTDKVACILPFEEQYFRQHGVDATYVGHPLFDELPKDRERREGKRFPERAPVIGLLPGSRRGIARHNFPHQLDVARRVRQKFPGATFLVPTTDATHDVVVDAARGCAGLTIDPGGFDRVVPQCDFCVTVSGTAALHVAAYGVPQVVVYRGNPVLWHLVGRWVVKARTYSLVNILAGRVGGREEQISPEFIPWYGSNGPVAEAVVDYLRHPGKMAEQRRLLLEVVRPLDQRGASMNAARLGVELMGRSV
jgi:lipid-A-disaccharide synthase